MTWHSDIVLYHVDPMNHTEILEYGGQEWRRTTTDRFIRVTPNQLEIIERLEQIVKVRGWEYVIGKQLLSYMHFFLVQRETDVIDGQWYETPQLPLLLTEGKRDE